MLGPLHQSVLVEPRLETAVIGQVRAREGWMPIPRFIFRGPSSGMEPLRLAIFSLVHGDEPAGALALVQLLVSAVRDPAIVRGLDLYCYPVCNPTGYEDGTRFNRAGVDLNREFWRGSSHPEVQTLETELRTQRFDGLVALHADCDSPGLYAFARGPVISEELLAPALAAAERVLPRNTEPTIDGFSARHGVIRDCYCGVLSPPPEQSPAPFEIILETPGCASLLAQAQAAFQGLRGIIAEMPRLYMGGADI
ncbi:MAG: succinylglutamate desuccinylase/aspartoacylase family protein [Opitutaceae bacterium]|nr:succinylglutamate desuccinylase/aspartoacylase family protein [Opitutaceae bacterium]